MMKQVGGTPAPTTPSPPPASLDLSRYAIVQVIGIWAPFENKNCSTNQAQQLLLLLLLLKQLRSAGAAGGFPSNGVPAVGVVQQSLDRPNSTANPTIPASWAATTTLVPLASSAPLVATPTNHHSSTLKSCCPTASSMPLRERNFEFCQGTQI